MGRIPFLLIAGRLYGADSLGRLASALVVIEFLALLSSMGLKRGLARRLTEEEGHPANAVGDAMLISVFFGACAATALWLFPAPMFPSGRYSIYDLMLPLAIIPITMTDIALAALAYHFNVGATVKARSIVEPWTISGSALGFYYLVPDGGLALAFIFANVCTMLAAVVPLVRAYGLPQQWRPHPFHLLGLARANLPLALAEGVEWGSRRLDVFILGMFASPSAVGVYYIAQQVASLPQKLKTSFEPILGPVITRSLKNKDYHAIALQVCQVGFWITAAQCGIALALGIPGEGVMGLVGPHFVGGTGALAFLLAAEVVAATAVVADSALIYMARMKNLAISLLTIAIQAGLTVGGILLVDDLGLDQLYRAAAAAAALMLSLAIASVLKSWLLSRLLGERINNWRWPLVWAAAAASVVGWAATRFLPEWAELAFGIPAILAVYCWVIWNKGFGPEDRVLFRKSAKA
ncbi:lipopolysaccharide biosynthesis protein [Novosphingobium sp. JCM 18896]|nr:lipopolysaccharide biosynthesis protein [Novosphingobium sp. JCM 18896]MCW1428811.1 lipopolysaccharide biosynthesis protein [Novosphingobium sp. JCM 18896]